MPGPSCSAAAEGWEPAPGRAPHAGPPARPQEDPGPLECIPTVRRQLRGIGDIGVALYTPPGHRGLSGKLQLLSVTVESSSLLLVCLPALVRDGALGDSVSWDTALCCYLSSVWCHLLVLLGMNLYREHSWIWCADATNWALEMAFSCEAVPDCPSLGMLLEVGCSVWAPYCESLFLMFG